MSSATPSLSSAPSSFPTPSSSSSSSSPSLSSSSSSLPTSRSLYGGSLSISLPLRFEDVSPFRQVPNHQEVFADADTDQSIVIEINQYEKGIKEEDGGEEAIGKYYFDDYAEANEAIESKILSVGKLTPSQLSQLAPFPSSASFVIGEQRISKFKESASAANVIHVYIAIIRLKEHESDVLVIFNVPVRFGLGSSSEGRPILAGEENKKMVEEVLKSFRIIDYSLFNGSS